VNGTVWAILLLAYGLGSIPFGLILHRFTGGGDSRTQWSGNIGATNVLRSGGKIAGIATLFLDAGKGVAATLGAMTLSDDPAVAAGAAFAAVLGHCHPIWLRFRGGKGVATACGAYFPLAPIPMTLALALFAAIFLATRIVSLGSLGAGVGLIALIVWMDPSLALLLSVAASLVLVIVRHRENIERLLAGRERRMGDGRQRDA